MFYNLKPVSVLRARTHAHAHNTYEENSIQILCSLAVCIRLSSHVLGKITIKMYYLYSKKTRKGYAMRHHCINKKWSRMEVYNGNKQDCRIYVGATRTNMLPAGAHSARLPVGRIIGIMVIMVHNMKFTSSILTYSMERSPS